MTLDEAMRKIIGVLSHPAFEKSRPDIVVAPRLNGVICISGPQHHLDGISRALRHTGMELDRPAPATLLVTF